MSPLKIPVVKTDSIFHIGTLNRERKGSFYADSLEGHCLSVSHCPKAWMRIARLGGNPLWEMSKRGAMFLDIHKAAKSKALRNEIEQWGFAQHYIEHKPMWRAWQTDEDGEWGYMLFNTEELALQNVEEEDGGPRGKAVEPMQILMGTDRLAERVGFKSLSDRDAFDFLATVWAEDTQPLIDGVWWCDEYAPFALSAPRGGVFPDKVTQWTRAKININSQDNDEWHMKKLKCGFILAEVTVPTENFGMQPT